MCSIEDNSELSLPCEKEKVYIVFKKKIKEKGRRRLPECREFERYRDRISKIACKLVRINAMV